MGRSNGNVCLPSLAARRHIGGLASIVLHRIEENALRPTEGPNRLKAPVANAVVDGPAGDPEQFCGMVQRNAATDTRLKAGFRTAFRHCHSFLRMRTDERTPGATSDEVAHDLGKLLPHQRL
jgi:hypothetical protein